MAPLPLRHLYPRLSSFASLHAAGCRYVQIDETSLVKLGDERARQLLARLKT